MDNSTSHRVIIVLFLAFCQSSAAQQPTQQSTLNDYWNKKYQLTAKMPKWSTLIKFTAAGITLGLIYYLSTKKRKTANDSADRKFFSGKAPVDIINIILDYTESYELVFTTYCPLASTASFSPDGKKIVTQKGNSAARLYNIDGEYPKRVWDFSPSSDPVSFNSDGTRLVTTSIDQVIIWSTSTGKRIRTLQGTSSVTAVAFSPDGKQLVTGNSNGTAHTWNAHTNALIQTLPGNYPVTAVAFSSDSKQLATGNSHGDAQIWKADKGDFVRTLLGKSLINSAAFSPDDKQLITVHSNDTARIWNLNDGSIARTLENVTLAVFHPDGRTIATANKNHSVQILSLSMRNYMNPIQILPSDNKKVTSIAFNTKGNKIVTVEKDNEHNGTLNKVRIWQQ